VSDEEMSIGAGGEAENAAMPSTSSSNLSGGGGDIGAVREAGDGDVSSPPNLSAADMSGAVRDGIWPGSDNVSLLSHFVFLHFAGDLSAYLQFAHWADAQSMLYPNVPVRLDSWLSLKSDLAGGVAAPEGDHGLGGLPAGAYGELGSNMCNKTCTDSVNLPRHSTSSRILFPKGSSGHPDTRSIFPAIQARAFQWASRVMENEIALQAAEEAACMARVQALRVKFAAAAQLKFATLDAATAQPMPVPQVSATAQHKSVPPEKEVTWSPQEAVCWSETLDAEMEDTPAVPIPPAEVKRGSAFRNANKLKKLIAQLQEQEQLAAATSVIASSLCNKEKVVELLQAQALETPPAATPDVGSISTASAGQAVPPRDGNPVKSSLFSDLRTLRQDAQDWGSLVKMSLPFLAADSLSGLSLLTSPTPNRPSTLNSLNYSSTPHNPLLQNEVDKTQGTSMFSMFHRTAPGGSSGHFWFLQVRFKYLEDNDSKTTILLGLSLLMDILPDAIDGFALHPLEPDSTLPALANNKTEDGFPGSAVLAFKYFLVKNKSNRVAQQTVSSPSQPSLHRHNDKEEYRPPTALW
jgi:hypothetical protein